MITTQPNKKPWLKKVLIAALVLLVAGGAAAWYIFNVTFDDTSAIKPDFTVNASDLINEFKANDTAANKKYTEKIIAVNGRISAVEAADTSINLKITAPDESYIIFAFQQKDMAEAKKVKAGDSVSIKGSCSGGTYSEILGTEYITFKRCTINH